MSFMFLDRQQPVFNTNYISILKICIHLFNDGIFLDDFFQVIFVGNLFSKFSKNWNVNIVFWI